MVIFLVLFLRCLRCIPLCKLWREMGDSLMIFVQGEVLLVLILHNILMMPSGCQLQTFFRPRKDENER